MINFVVVVVCFMKNNFLRLFLRMFDFSNESFGEKIEKFKEGKRKRLSKDV